MKNCRSLIINIPLVLIHWIQCCLLLIINLKQSSILIISSHRIQKWQFSFKFFDLFLLFHDRLVHLQMLFWWGNDVVVSYIQISDTVIKLLHHLMIRLRKSSFFIRQFLLETSNFSLCLRFKILFLDQYFLKFFKSDCSIFSSIYSFELTQIKLARRTFFDQVIEFYVRIISFFESKIKLSHDLFFRYIFSSCFLV